jgi:tRNA-dihydrouridine synthase
VKEMRKHAAWYLKGMPGSARVKAEIFKTDTSGGVKKILLEYLDQINKNTL